MYADYIFYSETYHGNEITEAEFTRLMNQASAYIDLMTFNRAADEDDEDNIVLLKKAACAAAEALKKQEEGGALQSERVGNLSVTYADTPSRKLSIEKKVEQAIKLYLGNTDLMYRGFASGEYGGEVSED